MKTENGIIKTGTVVAGGSATKGYAGKFAAGGTVDDCGAGETGFCVFLNSAAAGEKVRYMLLAGGIEFSAKVGTGDATQGAYLSMAADGFIDAVALGGGTTVVHILAIALESGVAGDEIAAMPCVHTSVT